ncbi:MAG TPA: hypothetical protein VNH18_14625, partial [Bryobacteraceae bacterium]|nr:hypothetical protein [Bryobacteraceae bacterium]
MREPGKVSPGRKPIVLWLVFLLCFAATLALRARTDALSPGSPNWNEPIDHWKYEYIAEHPLGSFHIQPTCWRIGVPILARMLPFSTYRNFDLLGIIFFGLSGGFLYLWLLAIPRPRDEAILGVVMFYSMGAAVKLVLGGVETPDPASYFFIILALYAIYSDRDYLCAAALAMGMFTKETLAVVIPLHYALKATRLVDLPRLRKSVLVGLPAVCVFVAIRIAIPAWNDHDDYVKSLPFIYTQVSAGDVKYDVVTAFRGVLRVYHGWSPIDLLRLFTWGSLGLPLFLPFFAPRENKNVLLRWAPYWVPIVVTLLIALNADRRMGSLFPFLILAALNGVRVLAHRFDIGISAFQAVFLIQFALLLLKKDLHIVPFDLAAAVFF